VKLDKDIPLKVTECIKREDHRMPWSRRSTSTGAGSGKRTGRERHQRQLALVTRSAREPR